MCMHDTGCVVLFLSRVQYNTERVQYIESTHSCRTLESSTRKSAAANLSRTEDFFRVTVVQFSDHSHF